MKFAFCRLLHFVQLVFYILEFLCKAEYLSIDPYQRLFASMLPLGSTVVGYQVAELKNLSLAKKIGGLISV